MFAAKMQNKSRSSTVKIAVAIASLLFVVVLGPALLNIDVSRASGGDEFCTRTANKAFEACKAEALDDYYIARGNCINLEKNGERRKCFEEAEDSLAEANELCKDQKDAREDVCDLLGEDRYDPDFDPKNFVDPLEIGKSVDPNPYFPLKVGNMWEYKSTFEDEDGEWVTEIITVKVTDKIKLIEGVPCIVVTDLVEECEGKDVCEEDDRKTIEDTDDWYAQDKEGNVWYCGEIARNFETFEGDDPEEPELVDIDGSWKAYRDGAKPGILVLFEPKVGDAYRQEMALGEAEDVAEVISIEGTASVPAAECKGDCLVTRDFTPLEPGIIEYKYYKKHVGLILEVDMEGNRVELVNTNVKP